MSSRPMIYFISLFNSAFDAKFPGFDTWNNLYSVHNIITPVVSMTIPTEVDTIIAEGSSVKLFADLDSTVERVLAGRLATVDSKLAKFSSLNPAETIMRIHLSERRIKRLQSRR